MLFCRALRDRAFFEGIGKLVLELDWAHFS